MAASFLVQQDQKAFFNHADLSAQSSPADLLVLPESLNRAKENILLELPPQHKDDHGKLTVVLDVDETLVHTQYMTEDEKEEDPSPTNPCFYLTVSGSRLKVTKRPFLDTFLQEASKTFELIAYTAGCEEYAMPLLDALDPQGTIFRHRLSRRHCVHRCGGSFVKDLRLVNRSLERTVLVDNNAHSFLLQLENGIPISTFINDMSDQALLTLYHFLHHLAPESDVRFPLARIFRLGAMFGDFAQKMFPEILNQNIRTNE